MALYKTPCRAVGPRGPCFCSETADCVWTSHNRVTGPVHSLLGFCGSLIGLMEEIEVLLILISTFLFLFYIINLFWWFLFLVFLITVFLLLLDPAGPYSEGTIGPIPSSHLRPAVRGNLRGETYMICLFSDF